MKLRPYISCLFYLSAVFICTPASAAWYQVEIIVFDQLEPDYDGENWLENPGLPDRSSSIELIEVLADNEVENAEPLQDKVELIPYLRLPVKDLRLEGIERVLKLSKEYRPLLHLAWQQPGFNSNNARAVHLQKFEDEQEIMIDSNADSDKSSQFNENSSTYQVLDLIFDGLVRVRSSKFLHVDLDFAYFPAVQAKETRSSGVAESIFSQQTADYVRLQESRKIRLNEIQYFDHPMFGVILRVSRLRLN